MKLKIIIFIFIFLFLIFLLSKSVFASNETSSTTVNETSTLNEIVTDTTVDDDAVIVPEVTIGDILVMVSIAFLSGICIVSIVVKNF